MSAASASGDASVLSALRAAAGRRVLPMAIAPLVGETVGRVSDSLQRLRRAGLPQASLGGWVAVEEPRP